MPDKMLDELRASLEWARIAKESNLTLPALIKWYADSVDNDEYERRFSEWLDAVIEENRPH